MYSKYSYLFLLMGTLLLLQCATDVKSNDKTEDMAPPVTSAAMATNTPAGTEAIPTSSFPYQLKSWAQKMSLPRKLTEISGLEYHEADHVLLAINDEKGKLFSIDPNNGEVLKTEDFGKSGDYEGVAIWQETVYVTKSNGTLTYFDETKPKNSDKIKTALSTTNDVEGLCTDQADMRLLIACKGSPGIKGHPRDKSTKTIYAYSLTQEVFVEEPAFVISDDQLEDYVKTHYADKFPSKKQLKKMADRAARLSPSGIAVHPTSGHLYILSSIGKLLIVLDRTGEIMHIEFLNENHHKQPEGICFRPNGDLFISNEGKGLRGTIYQFKML